MGVLVFQDGEAVDLTDAQDIKVQVYTYGANGAVVGRAWETVASLKVRSGGVWVDVWPKPFAEINDYIVYGGGLLSGYRINANGNAEWVTHNFGQPFPTYFYGVIEKWLKKGTSNLFVVKAEKDPNPGYATPTGVLNQWIDCSTSPQWTLEESSAISLLTITIGRVDNNGEGLGITTDGGVDLETESGVQLTDTNITVTPMDSAQVTLSNWT